MLNMTACNSFFLSISLLKHWANKLNIISLSFLFKHSPVWFIWVCAITQIQVKMRKWLPLGLYLPSVLKAFIILDITKAS